MVGFLAPLFELIDAHFMRMLWVLFIDALISQGFLMPEQRAMWVEGWGNLILIGGTVASMLIWQYKAHHKTVTVKTEKETTINLPEEADNKTDIESITDRYLKTGQ